MRCVFPRRRHSTHRALRAQARVDGPDHHPVFARPRRPAIELRPRPKPPGGDAMAQPRQHRRGAHLDHAARRQWPFGRDPGRAMGVVPPAGAIGPHRRQLAGPLQPAPAGRRCEHRL